MSTNIENLSEEQHAKWHEFIDRVNAVVDDVFTEEDHPAIVLGVQWGDMGRGENNLPVCLTTSNLPACVTPDAVRDMLAFSEAAHEEFHGLPVESGEGVLKQPMDPDNVPEEIRQQAIEWAESMGYSAEDITFVEVADTSDLDQLPLFDPEAEQESKEQESE